ncbi:MULTISPECIES: PP0621 family protein [unclassified Cobetia]|uniref:PP0621 family protein n=1 Tax=unclassified Cobetia TaxID=2609414 RepID=UPI00159E4446|nr:MULTISPECIES: PP0621 family protein [unclassified Cobetia]MCO7233774.1 hypothetical protein [Cobetia sp. Dlab-2-AX]MCO7236965.1 hypothetical protein [Cobetia sp. Dlab-2-U]NVN57331.1 hypothetical protein [bacterium Scap17]
MSLLIIRLLVFAALFWAGLRLYRMYRQWKLSQDDYGNGNPAEREAQNMVRCAYCDLHLPENDAIRHEALHFCCQEHQQHFLDEGPRK